MTQRKAVAATHNGVDTAVDEIVRIETVSVDGWCVEPVAAPATDAGRDDTRLVSGADHDATDPHATDPHATVLTVVFVPSVDASSHHKREYTE